VSTAETHRDRQAGHNLSAQQEAWFAEWWSEYWLHVAEKPAREVFRRVVTTEPLFREVMAGLHAQKKQMLSREERYRPQGATWLNKERWKDEINPRAQLVRYQDYPDYPE
jgi:hypothetical protein